ncbi:MAG: Uma2 family endonuclease [Stenomitos rutilans HA7619-LM2]|jgi:Uma2 family endonuclease|nr:Uma2 family endonuclease [Stenomitos rutilans HA7619-LM2]
MVQQYDPLRYLPTDEDLPSSDETPVDNELQNLIPNLLLTILATIWDDRQDWFFGVDMGIYYIPEPPYVPIIPDGFLSLGVERRTRGDQGRLSYLLWRENNIPPILALETVSETYNGEYDTKMAKYIQLGVLYYIIYNHSRQRPNHEPFEVYRLDNDRYIKQSGEPFWMPEVGIAIGRGQGKYAAWEREWLYWFDENGDRYPTPDEQAALAEQQVALAEQQAAQERQLREELLAKLRDRGIDPDTL